MTSVGVAMAQPEVQSGWVMGLSQIMWGGRGSQSCAVGPEPARRGATLATGCASGCAQRSWDARAWLG